MENVLPKENTTSLSEKQQKLVEYLNEVNKYSIYSLNDFVEVFNDPSVLEGIDIKEFLKRKKIVRKMFERYVKEFLRDHDYEISLPLYDNGTYWFYIEVKNIEKNSFKIVKYQKENFIRDSVIVFTKLADYYLYLTEKGFLYGIIWNDDFLYGNSVVKLKIESYPYDQKSQSCLLKIMSHIRDLGSSIEYDF
jgi:hypothetical protein